MVPSGLTNTKKLEFSGDRDTATIKGIPNLRVLENSDQETGEGQFLIKITRNNELNRRVSTKH